MTRPESTRYHSTRHAWENIWDSASVEVELQTQSYPRSRATMAIYTTHLPKDGVILEAGCGLSAAVITLRRLGFHVVGLDYAANALHISRHYDPTLSLVVGDVHRLPHADNSLAAYLSFGVLEHFEHGMAPALKEAYRVLRPGGVLVLTIPYPNVVHRFVAWRRKQQNVSVLTDDDFYESTYTRKSLVQNVTHAGFTPVKVIPTSHAYTLWGLGGLFRGDGYYQTSALADRLGDVLRIILPWAFNFSTMVIARK